MKDVALDKIMDCIKESLEAGWTPNWLFMTPRFQARMWEPFEGFWDKPEKGKLKTVKGFNVWLVDSLPEGREVMATYLRSSKPKAKENMI